ncbi:MAG: tRNA guanosine(34) transglycosylase Tgt [Chloroflexia bacterium]
MARTVIHLPHGDVDLPVFLPDATLGVVRSLDSTDLVQCGIQALVMNTFHLTQRPGSSVVQALGGLHKMCAWQRPIITDSGGFQAYSMIRQNPKFGQITDKGIIFRPEGTDRKFQLTPEKAIQLQLSYGSDVVICLDDCTHVDAPFDVQEEAVRRTVNWAKRCKAEFQRLLDQKNAPDGARPLLFGVIQGGGFLELRKRCADALLALDLDGFGYGGWPLDAKGGLLTDILAYTRELVPADLPMHALGVGHPDSIRACVQLGYDLFDSALPTRDARQGRLYVPADETEILSRSGGDRFSYLYIADKKHIKSTEAISRSCCCLCCSTYSVGYLHHLFKIGDSLFFRLATIHNLTSMTRIMGRLRGV